MNSRFMLDTDSVSFVMRAQGHVAEHMVRHRPEELCVSVVTLAELRYGADLLKSRKLHGMIGKFDVLIAAHAMAVDATLVTNNVKHFACVAGLRVENWF
jgi:tRNA(fMet)-specific endonuclease VapC